MKHILTIIICLVTLPALQAQTANRSDADSRQTPLTRLSASPNLAEAEQLSKQTVELYKAEKFDKALPLARRALQIREAALAPSDPPVISAVNNLAFTLMAKEKYGEARTMFARSLALMEAKLGRENIQLVNTITQLALAHYKQEEHNEAEALFSQAFELREKKDGLSNANTLESLYLLADFY